MADPVPSLAMATHTGALPRIHSALSQACEDPPYLEALGQRVALVIRTLPCQRLGMLNCVVQSKAENVEGYLAEVPEQRREALRRLRELCRQELVGFTEVMAYGMPAYHRDGGAEIAFASQKQYISFYLMRGDVRDAFAERLADHDMGKGCVRFTKPEQIDFDLVRDLLKATAAVPGKVC